MTQTMTYDELLASGFFLEVRYDTGTTAPPYGGGKLFKLYNPADGQSFTLPTVEAGATVWACFRVVTEDGFPLGPYTTWQSVTLDPPVPPAPALSYTTAPGA